MTMTDEKTDLQNHVDSIANQLTDGAIDCYSSDDDCEPSAFDWLNNALDIEYIVTGKGEYLGARVLVAFGGPNIWVDTRKGIVDGFWWGQHASRRFEDNIGLDDALSELWACR